MASTNLCSRPAAIIEHVRDGSVVRALLLPDYYLVTVMLSGIKVRFGCCCPLPAYRARCHLGALGTSEGPHPHPLLPRPSGVPWHRAWHSPWGARTVVGLSLRDGDTWGQQAPAWWGMPWEGPRQLGEGWPHPTRRAQPLCGCVVGGFGGSWGHPCAPWCWGLLLRALWARPLLQHQSFFLLFFKFFSPFRLNLAVFLAILSRTALGVCFRALVCSWQCLLGRVKGCVSTERPRSFAVHTSLLTSRGTWGFPPPLLGC